MPRLTRTASALERRLEERRSPFRAFLVPALWTAGATALLIAAATWFVLDRARAPRPLADGAPTAASVAGPAGIAGTSIDGPRAAPDDPEVLAIERRRAAGELAETRRSPGGCVVERVAWVDAAQSRIHKVVERHDDGATVARWFDAAGRLRAFRASRGDAILEAIVGEGGRVAQERGSDAGLRARALAVRDPSTALFGPPRCQDPR
jgi:hypothetical protein